MIPDDEEEEQNEPPKEEDKEKGNPRCLRVSLIRLPISA